MIREMLEPRDENTTLPPAAPDTTGEQPKEDKKDYDPYCCTPPDTDPGPIDG